MQQGIESLARSFTGTLSVESTAQEVIDLNSASCRRLLELKPAQILIVMGWLQGYFLDEPAAPIVDFAELSTNSRKLTERCEARPDEEVMTAAETLFGR
jgi:HdeA/HdeB family protein